VGTPLLTFFSCPPFFSNRSAPFWQILALKFLKVCFPLSDYPPPPPVLFLTYTPSNLPKTWTINRRPFVDVFLCIPPPKSPSRAALFHLYADLASSLFMPRCPFALQFLFFPLCVSKLRFLDLRGTGRPPTSLVVVVWLFPLPNSTFAGQGPRCVVFFLFL